MNDKDDVSSIASDDSFVVVIPDCFEPGVPLLNQSPKSPVNSVQQQTPPIVQQQAPPTVQQKEQPSDNKDSSVNLMTFEEPVVAPTQPVRPTGLFDTNTAATVVSKPLVLESSKPPPVTPKQMITNPRTHIWGKNPLQVAAGFIDGAVHQFDTHVGQPSGVYATATPKTTAIPKQQPSSTSNQSANPTTKQPSAPPMMAACNDTTGSDDEEEFKVIIESNFAAIYRCDFRIVSLNHLNQWSQSPNHPILSTLNQKTLIYLIQPLRSQATHLILHLLIPAIHLLCLLMFNNIIANHLPCTLLHKFQLITQMTWLVSCTHILPPTNHLHHGHQDNQKHQCSN